LSILWNLALCPHYCPACLYSGIYLVVFFCFSNPIRLVLRSISLDGTSFLKCFSPFLPFFLIRYNILAPKGSYYILSHKVWMTSLYDTNQIGVWAVPGQIPPFLLVLSSLWRFLLFFWCSLVYGKVKLNWKEASANLLWKYENKKCYPNP